MSIFTIPGAFVAGLAHTLEPCEDKVVVSILTVWGAKKWKESIPLIIIYGLAMTLINTTIVATIIYFGADLIEGTEKYFALIAAIIFILFGMLTLLDWRWPGLISILHHHGHQHKNGGICILDKIENEKGKKIDTNFGRKKFFDKTKINVLLLGMVRGLPYCPVELAVMFWAISFGNILEGIAVMFTFGIATTIGLIPIGILFGVVAQKAKKSRYGKYVPRVCGLAIVIMGIILLLLTLFGIELHAHHHI